MREKSNLHLLFIKEKLQKLPCILTILTLASLYFKETYKNTLESHIAIK